jgi:hypothetical protein
VVLAKHYRSTDEEPDFILNYNLKYRMDQEGDGGQTNEAAEP